MNVHSIQTVAVLGLGTMGHGIAQTFAVGGFAVRCYDELPSARATLHDRARVNLQRMAEAGIVPAPAIDPSLARLTVCASEGEAAGPAQFVVEAVAEDLGVKQDLFARVEPLVAPETILASNSSSYPISQTADRLERPERTVLTHWFNPPHIVPVVEVVPGRRTSEETTRTTVELHERIGKTAVRINKEVPGFLVNRVQVALFREVWDLLERGIASAEEIDRAIRGSMGLRLAALGPLQILDFAGLDITGRVYENLAPDLRADAELPPRVQALVEQGHFGVKAGKGFFDWPAEAAEAARARRDRLYLALVKLLQDAG
jgi:3-hydroxyacyl-CoA dehydrogenase